MLQVSEMKDEIQWSYHVNSVLVQLKNVTLELGEHCRVKSVLKKFCNVIKLKHHLFVEFDAYF